MPAVTIPGVGRVNFPDSMPTADIQAAASKLADRVGIDPNTGNRDPDLAILDEMMTDTARGGPRSGRPETMMLPFLGGRTVTVNGPLADFARWTGNIDDET